MAANAAGPISFVDIGNRYLASGPSYSPQVLAGMTRLQVARVLHHPGSPQARAIEATASYYIAAICQVTGGKPATRAAARLPAPR